MLSRLVCILHALILAATSYCQVSPITVTGFNQDAIAEGPPNSLTTTTMQLDGGSSNKVMYTNAFRTFAGIAGGGLPDNGLITAGGDSWQLAPYNGNNALFVKRNESFTLTVSSPASFARIKLLSFTTEGASSLNISLTFTDGSTVNYLSGYSLPDWFNGTTNLVLQGFGRCDRSVGPVYNADAFPSNPRMYFIDIPLTCTDAQKLLQTITINNVSTFPNNAPFPNAVILAVSGAASTYTENAVITPSDCSGNGSITLNVNGSSAPYTITWNTNPVQTGPTATGLPPGTYTATITDAGGCTRNYSGTVTLNDNSSINAVASPAAICPGGTSQLTANVVTGPLTNFIWTPGNATSTSVTVNPANTTTYTVTGTNSIGCFATAQVTVSVQSSAIAPIVNDVSVCTGSPVTLNVQNPQPGYTYNWYDAANGGIFLSTGTSYTTPPMASTFTFHVEAVSIDGCFSIGRTPVVVTVTSLPVQPVATHITGCASTDVTFNVTVIQPGVSYSWFLTPTGGTPFATGPVITIQNVTTNTSVYVEASSGINCTYPVRVPATFTVRPPLATPVVTVLNVSFTSVTFSWQAIPGAVNYEVSTNGGQSFFPPSSGANGTTHTVSGLSANQTVTIQVRANGATFCETSAVSLPVSGTSLNSAAIFVPNVFTPNNDGSNDRLFVLGNGIQSMQFRIFNQWGELIFSTENAGNGWDGTFKGKAQPVGVYAYTLKVTLQDNSVINKKGSISLIR